MSNLNENRQFYKKLLLIGIPVLFQNLISIGLNLIDTLMIGKLGEQELAAVGAANQIYFIFAVTLFGLFSGAAVYTAQYWGAQDLDGIKKLLGIDYMVGTVFALIVSAVSLIFSKQIIGIFSKDPEVISFGVNYIRIAAFSYVISGFSMAISYNSRAIQQLVTVTAINAAALGINAILNYILIFGKLGVEAMGVQGAAVATLLARIFELSALLIYIYSHKNHPLRATFKQLSAFSGELFSDVMKTAVPVVFTEGSWAVSMTLTFAAYGKLGTSALAVTQIANVVCDMLQSVFFGVGNATAMIIGEQLGQKKKDDAYLSGGRSVRVVYLLNAGMTVIMLLLAKPIASIYNFSGETNHLLIVTLLTMAILITPKMLGYIYIVGVFRAGGDTLFCMKLELFCNVCVQVPIAYISVMVFHLSLPLAMVLVETGNLIRIIVSMPRYKSKKWINIVT